LFAALKRSSTRLRASIWALARPSRRICSICTTASRCQCLAVSSSASIERRSSGLQRLAAWAWLSAAV